MATKKEVRDNRIQALGTLMKNYRLSFQTEGREGLTRKEVLSRMSEVSGYRVDSESTLARWEEGKHLVPQKALRAFGAALNLTQVQIDFLVQLRRSAQRLRRNASNPISQGKPAVNSRP